MSKTSPLRPPEGTADATHPGIGSTSTEGAPTPPKRPGVLARCLGFAGPKRSLVVLALVFAALSAVASFVPFVAVYLVISETVSAYPDMQTIDGGLLGWYGLLALAGVMADVGLYLASLLCSHAAAFDTQYRLKLRFADHLGRIPLGHIARLGTGRLSKIMDESTSGVETFIAHSLPDLAASVAAPVTLFVLMFVFDWRFGLAATAAIVLAGVVQFSGYADKRIATTMGRYQNVKEQMGNATVEYVRGMPVVKAFGQEARSFARLSKAVKDYTALTLEVTLFFQNSMPGFTSLLNNAYLFILPVGILLAPTAADWPAFALSFIFYLLFVPSIAAVFTKILYVSEDGMVAQANIERIDSVLEIPALTTPGSDALETPSGTSVELRSVGFSYEKEGERALHDVSFMVPAGSTCALVGPSGSGKSTVANLIARFWDVDEGSVRVGGTDVRHLDPNVLMSQMSLVFQDVHLFRESVADNIRRGRAEATRQEVEAAARAAQASGFIDRLPHGFDTLIGAEGVHLSGGERQRLSIARAMVSDAPIVILDEATAFADAENEHLIQQALDRLTADKTVIMIAHRLSTVIHADQIIVMDAGHVVQRGTHDDLSSQNGTYRRMWEHYTRAIAWRIGDGVQREDI